MENSEIGTLEDHSIFGFHRRRPLRSQTFDTLIRIFSNCYVESKHSQAVLECPPNSDGGIAGPTLTTEHDDSLDASEMVPDELLLQKEKFTDESIEGLRNQEGVSYMKHTEIDVYASNMLQGRVTTDSMDNSNLLGNKLNTLRICTEEFTALVEADPTLGVDKIVRSLNPLEGSDKLTPQAEMDLLEEVGDEMQCTRKESGMDSSSHLITVDTQVEEGEISGDLLPGCNISPVGKTGNEVCFSQEVTSNSLQKAFPNHTKSIPLSVETIGNTTRSLEAVAKEKKRNLVDYSEMFVNGKTLEAVNSQRKQKHADAQNKRKRQGTPTKELRANKKVCSLQDELKMVVHEESSVHPVRGNGCMLEDGKNQTKVTLVEEESIGPSACPENSASLGDPLVENVPQKEIIVSDKKDDNVVEKKKRILTKERRAKKKQKERIKRAEMNRKLGVKRLKIQPVVKPKTVTYCRHYLVGRCQEGEKCKFSHDTTPLTKSKPCCHFARNACMKGDDCPFDHQLSKYPCNNHISKGFCNRGAGCMFSHEMQANEGSSDALKEAMLEQKSSSTPQDDSRLKKQLSISGPSVDKAKSCSVAVSSASKNQIERTPKPAVQVPKGMSFLSHRKLSSGEATSSAKVGNGPKPVIHTAANITENTNTVVSKKLAVAPRGINFLSFGQKPLSGNSSSNMSFKRGSEKGKSPLSDKAKDSTKVDSQVSQSTPGDSRDKANGGSTIARNLLQNSFLLNAPSSLHGALQSTLAFASKLEFGVKMGSGNNNPPVGAAGFKANKQV